MKTSSLLILGSGTFAVEALDIAEACGDFKPLGFVNSLERPKPGATHEGLPVFWVDDLPYGPGECALVAAIVSTRRMGLVERMEARGYEFASLVHPGAAVSPRAHLGPGCIVHAGVVISAHTRAEGHVIFNRGALVGHDIRFGRFCTLGPGSNVAGGVQLDAGVYVGVGAVVRDHLSIGGGTVVGAGAVVVEALPAHVMAVGVPAKIIRRDIEGF